jgi:hypothetical protein
VREMVQNDLEQVSLTSQMNQRSSIATIHN